MAKTPRWAFAVQVAAAAVILGGGWWAFLPGGYLRPIGFPRDEAVRHMPPDRPERLKWLIRLPEIVDSDHQYWDQTFEIAVNPAGHPATVRFLPSGDRAAPSAIADSAIAQIRTWQFVPFEAKGHLVHAFFVAQFELVPEQDRPGSHTPIPPVTDLSKVVMTYDECGPRRLPRAVTVRGDGTVEIANTSVLSQQHFQTTVSGETVKYLIEAFRRADFFSLKDAYGGTIHQTSIKTVSLTIDRQTKTVRDIDGEFGGLPDAVMDIEDAIQRAGGLEP
jgi:hypothetical protein